MDDECLVLVLAHQVLQKGIAGDALLLQHASLTHAGVDQQTEREREIGLFGEVANRLRAAVFLKLEVVFAKVVHDLAVFVSDRRQHIHYLDVGRKGRGFLTVQTPRQRQERSHCQQEDQQR